MKASVALALFAGTCGVIVNSVAVQDSDYSWHDSSGDGSDDYDYFPEYVGNFLSGRTHDVWPSSPSLSSDSTARPVSTSLHATHSYPPSGGSPTRWFTPPRLPNSPLLPVLTQGAGSGAIPSPSTTIPSLSAFSSSVFPQRASASLPLPHQGRNNRKNQAEQIDSRSGISSNHFGSGASSGSQGRSELLTGVDTERVGLIESKMSGFSGHESFNEQDLRPDLSTIDGFGIVVQSANDDNDADYFYEEDEFIGGSIEPIYDKRNLYEDVIEENDIILLNRQLEVPYGRVRYLDSENDLKIKVLPGHHCQVIVIKNDPVTQRPGKLTPSNFTCNFGLNEVQYTHLGGRHLSEDTVKLMVRYDTHRNTFIVPFTLSTRILYDMQLEVVIKLVPLNVDKLLGISNPIDRGNIVLAFDDSRHECKIALLQRPLGLPRYGTVVFDMDNPSTDYMLKCYKFLESGIRYQHTVESSTKLDYIPAVVELYDKNSMTLFKQEYFQFPVRIHAGSDNTPPSVSFESLLLLDVTQFVMTALTRFVVTAVDSETPTERLIFNVTKPLRYGEGMLVSTDDQNVPVASFFQRDVTNLKIAYKPPAEDSNSKRVFDVEFEILDDEGLTSPPFKVMIVVNPKMTTAPITTKNAGLELFEGQFRCLSSARNLEIADEDNLSDVTLTIIGGLKHGQLLLMGALTTVFSPADLDTGVVVYQHDHTDTYTDNLLLRMSDNQHEVEFLFPITIFPEDDEPPIAHVNTGLKVRKNEEVEVTPFLLSATDVDSDDANITFTLQDPAPRLGTLILRRPSLPASPEQWQYVNNQYEKSAMVWTQRDITDGFLHYVHRGAHQPESVMDRIYFKLSDNGEPPNESETMEIAVNVLSVDDIPPELSSGCSLSLMVHEHELTPLTKDNLLYTDLDSKNTSLIYRVQPLHNVDINDPMSPGSLVLTESPETIVESFTQAQINHHKISYKPPDQELGLVPRIIQFKFQVEDENRNHISGQTFTIFLTPVDNQPPEVLNRGLQQVRERSEVIITRQHLDVSDPDTDVDDLVFKVTQVPSHGSLLYNTLALATGNEFIRRDITNKFIRYVNNGKDEMHQDSFNLEVTDGVHTMPINFFIEIEPIDDEPPQLLEQKPNAVGAMVRVLEGQEAFITTHVLRATDPDSESIRLTFIVQEAPVYGRILLNGVPTSSFTQTSIERNEVAYKHDGGDIGKSSITDNFTLILSDMSDEYIYGGNRLEHVMVNITIEPVDNIAPQVFINSAITVDESSKSPITSENINMSDSDTDDEKLTCVITHQPRSGYVENTSPSPGYQKSRKGIPVTSFSLADVMLGHLNYVQSVYTKVEPREDHLVLHCTDGVNRSPEMTLQIYIEPYNDEMPELFIKEFVVMEGMALVLEPPVIEATDRDDPEEQLTFRVSRKPKYGRLLQHGPAGFRVIDQFTMGDLNTSSKILYNHDDSETTEDDFELQLTDENPEHLVKKNVKVKILPVNDEAPRLAVNTGLEVDIKEATIITNKELMGKDLDSHDQNITYIIRKAPRFGVIELLEHKTLVHLLDLISGMTFIQKNIDDGVIQYRHTGIPGVRDVLKFDLSDGKNINSDRIFYINIKGEDNIYPDIVNKGVELPEGGRVALTTDILSTSDLNSADELLNFTITRMPSKGYLEATNLLGIPIISFTQLQLAGNKVFYIHNSTDEVKMDSFEFVVTDGFNSVFRTFRISISDVDNKKPVLFVGELRVQEGGSKIVTPFELKLEDRDTAASLLRFTVTRIPLHGKLLFNTTRVTRQFTQSDLEANLITYHHDGSETLSDQIHFIATDGTHADFYVYPNIDHVTRKPQRLPIRVQPVDNGVPKIEVNEGASFLAPVGEDGRGPMGFVLCARVLAVEDRDTLPEALTYQVEVPPQCGQLVSVDLHNVSITSFTQEDVNERRVMYRLGDDVVSDTSDSFGFSVVDRGGNRLGMQVFRLEWSWVSLASAAYQVNETTSSLLVTLRRRGYLGHTVFITMELDNETASVTEDLHRSYARQVQFNPGQRSAEWWVRVVDDGVFEGAETLTLTLRHPVMTGLEFPSSAFVTISDDEDVSSVEFDLEAYNVEEDVGEVEVVLVRHGDASRELVVSCITHTSPRHGSAMGTVPTTVLSYSDYISRPDGPSSIVKFGPGERESVCRVVIIDDSLYEDEEAFSVVLSGPLGGILGHDTTVTTVTILPDHKDVPIVFFGESVYHVDESVGSIEVTLWRSGPDLSREATVQVASKALSPPQAQAGYDYVAVGRQVDFPAGVRVQSVLLTVLDDLGLPTLEGTEALTLLLHLPCNASLGDPALATVLINDSLSDLPRFEFVHDHYSGYEGGGMVTAWVTRSGDLSHPASVRCFTRQGSARVTEDFDERPDTEASSLLFQPGELEQPCMVIVVDDDVYEGREQLHLALGSPASPSAGGARLGPHNTSIIFINDKADKTTVGLEESGVSVEEPEVAGEERVVRLAVLRGGDTSTSVAVRLHTKDGSATSGKDYFPVSKEVVFAPNVTRVTVEVTVLGDSEKEHREAFTVYLKPLRGSSASKTDITTSKAIVYIEEMDIVADVTFPAPPLLVSLRDYDVASAAPAPIPGYPLICVTACNSRHPEFGRTSEGVNDSFTTFRWKVAAPSGLDGVNKDLKDVSSDTFFTSTRGITLDSVYFSSGSRVQCLARAHSGDGEAGLELASRPVTVALVGGLCPPRHQGTFGADPFTAKLQYTGARDPNHPNTVRVEVVIPHIDGMIPVLSTRQLANFQLTLSRDGTRVGNHRCSNLLDFHEVRTQYGFVTNMTRGPEGVEEVEPYQHSLSLRSPPSLRFYRALEVESCVWRWVGYYTMTELVTQCGGTVATDGQVLDAVQSFVSVLVPLYVSYVFHSPVATGGWQHTDLSTRLRMSFVYDTAILWRKGIGAPAESELSGFLYPTSMKLRPDGRLVVTCRTQTRFRGMFVMDHKASEHLSSVTCDDHPDLTFSLDLLRSQPTFAQPEQHWQFVSDFAVRDYSGSYVVHLLPCTVTEDVVYSEPLVCNPRHLISFNLQVRFQQVSDPVPEQFTLSTLFHLMRQRELWLSDLPTDFDAESDVSFYPGDRIYGRVMINPVQALGAGFHVTLEKCFVCTGVDGYVPKYNPDTDEYGCVADSPNLLHNFKIIDRGAPDTVRLEYLNVGFNARLAVDDPEPDVIGLLNQAGADGFYLDSTPLFQVSQGRQWFVHCIYTVRSEENAARDIGKRDVTAQAASYHHALSTMNDHLLWANRSHFKNKFPSSYKNAFRSFRDSAAFYMDSSHAGLVSDRGHARVKRANPEALPGGDNGRGTNMHRLALQLRQTSEPSLHNQDSEFRHIGVVSGVGCVVVLLACVVAVVAVRSRRGKVVPPGYMTVSPATINNLVSDNRHYHTHEEITEV